MGIAFRGAWRHATPLAGMRFMLCRLGSVNSDGTLRVEEYRGWYGRRGFWTDGREGLGG